MIQAIEHGADSWDVIVIGGGATGLGIAVDAASRGYRTVLVEQSDFAKGTSSRSTKLIHGGVRYLQQGNVGLVLEALRERGLLTQNAPHLVRHLSFIVPNYTWWEAPFYGIGLKIYDLLAGRLGLGPSKHLSREETLERLPTLEPEGLRGGTVYYDGQFDDARLAVSLARTAADHGGILVNYAGVTALVKRHGLVRGAILHDFESGREHQVLGRVVINATGAFADGVRRMDNPEAAEMIAPSQGVHLVLDRSFLPGESAIMVPKTDDGRVLFAIPWHGRALIGTTDTPVAEVALEPRPLASEIEFLLTHAARYLTKDPRPEDVLSAFAGVRPLVKTDETRHPALVPRDHCIVISESGLVTVSGGKWTTYRKMAEDALDQAVMAGGLPERPCRTTQLRLHGWMENPNATEAVDGYGADAAHIRALTRENAEWNDLLHPALPYRKAEVIWAVRSEMARTVEDVLSRRTRALLLDAKAAISVAPAVAHLMAQELGRNPKWEQEQAAIFTRLAAGYLVDGRPG